jgi:hypothetical protein
VSGLQAKRLLHAAFFCLARTFAHLALWAATIFLRADADMMRFAADELALAAITTGLIFFPALAHLAFWASAIFRLEAAEIIRFAWVVLPDLPEPFSDSITEIAWSNFSRCNCARLRSARSSWRALVRFAIVAPLVNSGRDCTG